MSSEHPQHWPETLLEPGVDEPERYELREPGRYRFDVDRRQFIELLGAGLLISVGIPSVLAQRRRQQEGASRLSDRLHIGVDGTITVLTGKVEVGQGSRTQLTQAAAEELRLPIDRIRLIMADSAVTPDDGGTAGSRTTPSTVPAVRRGCAAARELLLKTAAEKFGSPLELLSVRNGQVQGLGEEQRFGYADLARERNGDALETEIAPGVRMTDVGEWRVLGRSMHALRAREIVTGTHRYPSDIVRPGMLYGKILRPPSFGAELIDIDFSDAREAGVVAVRDGNFVGFAAPNSSLAEQARAAAAKRAKWTTPAQIGSDELFAHLRASSSRGRRDANGSLEQAMAQAQRKFSESYEIAYIQHAPMEPRAAVAEWNDGALTVWTGTQQPARVRDELARAFHLDRDRVRLIVPDTGGGFGGKHTGETAVEAARLAKEAGRPVSVRWDREEEFTWAYFRPAGVIDIAAGLNRAGSIVAWEHVNFNSGGSAIATPYRVPNTATEFRSCNAPLRSGSYRALASTANAFARESFMDSLAAAADADPLDFRLRHLENERLRNVLIAAAEHFGWKQKWKRFSKQQSTGVGLGCGIEKGSYVACCAQIELDALRGIYRVLHVAQAFECGAIQNPANLRAQVEGCILQGLGGATSEEIRFKDGKILNPRFSTYRVPRFKDLPSVEVLLLDRRDLPSVGGSETPIIGIAPAIGNALFHATGVRIRSLPIRSPDWRAELG